MQREPWAAPYALVYIDPDDDIATICGKVDTAPHQQVVLIAGKGNKALTNLLGMTILRRHAEAAGRDIAFVSPKGGLRTRARREGIRAFRSVRWVKFEVKLAARLRLALGNTTIAFPTYRTLWRVGLQLAVVAAALIAAYLLIPSATVVIQPEGRTVSQTLLVTASASTDSIDFDTMTVPAHFGEVPVEISMALVTTGTVTVGDGSATGVVVFVNQTEEPVVIPKGAEVATQSGIAFATVQEARLAAGKGKQVEAAIQALKPGSQANVRATDITVVRGPLRTKVLVTNPTPITGGSDKAGQGVSANDVERLRALATELMRQQGLEALSRRQKEEGIFVYPETARVLPEEVKFSHGVGSPTPWLIITARGRLKALAIKEQDIRRLTLHQLTLANPGDDAWVLDGSFRTDAASLSEFDDLSAKLAITTEMEVVEGLDEKQIVSDLRGRSASGARAYLMQRLRLRQPPRIDITPGWGFGIPRFDWRISLKVEAPPRPTQGVEEGQGNGLQSQ